MKSWITCGPATAALLLSLAGCGAGVAVEDAATGVASLAATTARTTAQSTSPSASAQVCAVPIDTVGTSSTICAHCAP